MTGPVAIVSGADIRDVIAESESDPAWLGKLLSHRQRRQQVPSDRRLRAYGGCSACMVKKRGRNLRAGQADQWTEEWFNGHGLHRLRGTIRYPKAA